MGKLAIGVVLAVVVLVAPGFIGLALLNALILVFVAALYAMGYNLLWGQTGLISFGHSTYFALGATTTVMAMQAIEHGSAFPTPLLPLVGALASFILGLVAGWFATIRTGIYFAMITVAITELVDAIAQRWDSMFGGEAGLTSMRMPWGPISFQSLADVYYFSLIWAALGIAFLWWLQTSPLGTVIRGIREREERVKFLGYDTHLVKTLVFAISAGISGMAGALLAFSNESANVVLFQGSYSTAVIMSTVVGGAQVFFGPAVGAALTTLFGYYVANMTSYWALYMGVLFIVTVMFAPRGVTGLAMAMIARLRGRKLTSLLMPLYQAIGGVGLAVAFVLMTEIIGAVVTPSYRALAISSKHAWPPVTVFGVAWQPSSPLTLGIVIGLFILGGLMVRGALPIARRNATLLVGALVKSEDEP
jgi:branched-chain amino acid transport system permease protein